MAEGFKNSNSSIIDKGYLFQNDRYEVIKKIGEGGFAFVYLVKDKQNDAEQIYALKMLKVSIFTERDIENYLNEINILIESKHKYISNYVDHFLHQNHRPCIITTYYDDGDLDDLIENCRTQDKKFERNDIISYMYQILKGLVFLHSNSFVHRDLNPKNIFRKGDQLVIGDLGLAKKFDQIRKSTKIAGVINYIPPECFENEEDDMIYPNADIWSLGCIFYELFTLKKAFNGRNFYQVMNMVVNGDVPQLNEPDMNLILQECLKRNPKKRPTSSDLLKEIKASFYSDEVDVETE